MPSKSCSKYDCSKEAKVRAAQRCVSEPGLTYVQALEEETLELRETMVLGLTDVKRNLGVEFDGDSCKSDQNPPKKLKGSCEVS
jgi:hypothetical protein